MQFKLDTGLLDMHYKRLQWQVHPDRLARHSQTERDYSAQSVMHINMAYQVLKDPLSRANYIVS
jgi:molecular chaperone HscB